MGQTVLDPLSQDWKTWKTFPKPLPVIPIKTNQIKTNQIFGNADQSDLGSESKFQIEYDPELLLKS